jgi:predicted nuclease of restriction endonuclease-like (RecB) superfamily
MVAAYSQIGRRIVEEVQGGSAKSKYGDRLLPELSYLLAFLGLPEDPAASETEVESSIISLLQNFLLEMGHGFSFVACQMRVSTETSHLRDLDFSGLLTNPPTRGKSSQPQ